MSNPPSNPAELATYLARQLEAAAIPYAIGGAVAYGFWGTPRGTQDLDLNLFVAAAEAGPVLDVLSHAGVQIDRIRAMASVQSRGDARGFFGDIPVDLFFVSIPFHESAAKRTARVSLLGTEIRVLSAEDLVVLKMLFFRGKDIVDVERTIAVQAARLDRPYIRWWLVECVGEDDERVEKWDSLCAALGAH